MLLFWVFTQIIEFQRLVWFDGNSLPVTVARSTLLTWEFPIKNSVVCINLLTIEQRQDIHAVDVLGQILGASSKSCLPRHERGSKGSDKCFILHNGLILIAS